MRSVGGIVAVGFILAALVCSFVLSNLLHWTTLTMGKVDAPLLGDRFTVTTFVAALLSFGSSFAVWRWPTANAFCRDVVTELKKVTWPTTAETRVATVVVVATSVVVSLVLGFFDIGFNWAIEQVF